MHAKVCILDRKRNIKMAKNIIKSLQENVQSEKLMQKKHIMILTFYEKKQKMKIFPTYFELLRLNTIKQKKERGIK